MNLKTENASCTILTFKVRHTCIKFPLCAQGGIHMSLENVRLFIRAAAATDEEEKAKTFNALWCFSSR